MTPKILAEGKLLLAKILLGQERPNYGIYVTYNNKAEEAVPDVDKEYFARLAQGSATGYARIPVLSSSLTDTGIVFTGLLTSTDLTGGKITRNTVLTGTTLAQLGSTPADDVFIYATLLKQPVKVVQGAYITVSVRLALGGENV